MFRIKIVLMVILFASLMVFPDLAAAKILSVQVKEGQLRSTPSFLGKTVARVTYGEKVTVIEDRGAWQKVTTGNRIQGWIHASALTTQKITLLSGAANVKTGTTSGELALAGKGFNAQVEAEFKSKSKLDFTWVDRMEKLTVQPAQMEAFLKEGHIIPPEGGDL
jgi:uncharacterized protein YgiM (DUF1202 family)